MAEKKQRSPPLALEDRFSLQVFCSVDKGSWWWEIRRTDNAARRARRSDTNYECEAMARQAGTAALMSLFDLLRRAERQK